MFKEIIVTSTDDDYYRFAQDIRKKYSDKIGFTILYEEIQPDDTEQDKIMIGLGYKKVYKCVIGANKHIVPDTIIWRKHDEIVIKTIPADLE
jgi:hypothetical protein